MQDQFENLEGGDDHLMLTTTRKRKNSMQGAGKSAKIGGETAID